MRVLRTRGLAGASGARGTVIVIDVLRAFTTAAYALEAGAREIWLVATPAEALALRAERPELVLVGEVGGKPIPGFDHGNSPERMRALGAAELTDRTLVLRSSSGVQGALRAMATATHCLLGSLVCASATARAARRLGLDVTLVAMGSPDETGPDGPEDEACAELLAALLGDEQPDLDRIVRTVRESPAARQALDPTIDWITPGDLECALAIDLFDLAIAAERPSRSDRRLRDDGRLIARRT